jgi:hypothetical protein
LTNICIYLYRPTSKSPRKQEAPKKKTPPKEPSPPPSEYEDDEWDEDYAMSLASSRSTSPHRSPSPPQPSKGKGKGKSTKAHKSKKGKGQEKVKEPATLRTETMAYSSDEEDEEDATQKDDGQEASPTGKKVFKSWALSDYWEPKAMEYLKAHDILWDKSHKDHSNKDLKKEAWEEFSRATEGTYSG